MFSPFRVMLAISSSKGSISKNRANSFVTLLSFSLFCSSGSPAQEKPAQVVQVAEQTLVVELTETAENSGIFYSNVQAQPVSVDSRNRFNLRIHNPGKFPLEFDAVKVGCNCLKVEFAHNRVGPGEWVEAVVEYAAPKRHRAEKYVINITLELGSEEKCRLSLSGRLEGVLEILADSMLESNGVFSSWKIPILSTPPIEASRLKLTMPTQMRDLEGKIQLEDGKPVLVISGPEQSLGPVGLAGEIVVEDPALGVQAKAQVSILKRPKVRISPQIVRFVRLEHDDNTIEASFLVQASTNVENTDSKIMTLPSNRIQGIECRSKLGAPICNTTKITDSLYRVKLRFSLSRDSPKECDLNWEVRTPEGAFEMSTLALFPEK